MVINFPTLTGSERFNNTMHEAARIRETGFRFDSSYRHADEDSDDLQERLKAAFYAQVSTVAANDIADDPSKAALWQQYL